MERTKRIWIVACGLGMLPVCPLVAVDYSLDIQPILSEHCFKCHGPDSAARQAELRLDVRESAIAAAIVPGDAAASPLLERIASGDPDFVMPPPASHKPRLSDRHVATIREWIDGGAEYDIHWSFRPLTLPEPPDVDDAKWVKNPIDQFILHRLESAGQRPSPEASRRELLRRIAFDLHGLPPSPAQLSEFEDDRSPRAFERLVNRVLDSDHFGERMAMYWLDIVRYADTNGIHGDNERPHDSYRDWVIRAFNDNLPFDAFIMHQLAGDLLPDGTFMEKIASGFNRLNMTTREGGAQPKEYISIYQADRVRNTSAIFMGVTLGCAQCHDHKFDPFTTREFYEFAAFFADVAEVPVGEQPAVVMRRIRHDTEAARIDDRIEKLEQELAAPSGDVDAAQRKWEQTLTSTPDVWTTLHPREVGDEHGSRFEIQQDGIVRLPPDTNPDRATFVVEAEADLEQVSALLLEVLRHDALPDGGPGRGSNGNFVLNELVVQVDDRPVKLTRATADYSQKDALIAHAIDGKPDTGWAIFPNVNQNHVAVFEFAEPIASDAIKQIRIEMAQSFGVSHTIGRFRWSATDQPATATADSTLALTSIFRIARTPPEERTAEQQQTIRTHFRAQTPLLAHVREELADLRERQKTFGGPRRVLITQAVKPRDVRVLPRGNWLDDSGPLVTPGVPAVMGELAVEAGTRPSRLDLARWLASPEHPLTARVYVNRLWKLAFGRGLVRTLDDFGAQGRIPSHPKLLDWLATELIFSGWDTKHVLRLIVTSATYRQSSQVAASLRRTDPENEWFGRQNRYRIDAEAVRDNALAISGLLNRQIGGPSVKPYQPAGYWDHLNFPQRKWQAEEGAGQYRRGLYTFWCRTFLHPAMRAFDAPTREECTVERPRSNTPLAALVLLNDPSYVEAASAFASRILADGGATIGDRIRHAYHVALLREPSEQEIKILTMLFAEQLAGYAAEPPAAEAILEVGHGKPPRGDAIEQAAWTAVARTILNLHETITRY